MKKLIFGLLLTVTITGYSQKIDKEIKPFLGSWELEFLDLPEGNMKATLVLEMKDTILAGELKNEMGSTSLFNIKAEGKQLKFSYMYSDYELYATLNLIEKDKLEGNVADMIDIVGQRNTEESE